MPDDPFADAFAAIDAAFDVGDDDAFNDALMDVARYRTPHPSRDALHAAAGVMNRMYDLAANGGSADLSPLTNRSLGWIANGLLKDLVTDRDGRNRAFVQRRINRALALRRSLPEEAPDEPIPLQHRPLDLNEARALLEPWFAGMERAIEHDPYCHLPLAWEVFEHPVPPFDTLFAEWLERLDEAGIGTGDSLPAIRRAMALAALSDERRQRVDPDTITGALLPQLADPHPMVAGCAGRFLGVVYSDPAFFVTRGEPEPFRAMLDHLANLPGVRRPAAGGFLMGYADVEDPFHKLKHAPALDGYDIDGWVLEVLADKWPEPYLPGSQSFWFYVHEGYCYDPAFIGRLLDAGHEGVALMTATEVGDRVEGMRPILERLTASESEQIAAGAAEFLTRVWSDA